MTLAAVPQDDAQLLPVKRDLAVERHRLVGRWLLIGKPLHNPAFDQRLFDQVRDVTRVHLAIENAIRVDNDDWPHGTEATATGVDHLNLVG
jgi:hypothetical protein